MGLLEGSGRGGKGADGTQKEVHHRHIECQQVERDRERRRDSDRWGGKRMEKGMESGGGRRGKRCVRYQRER